MRIHHVLQRDGGSVAIKRRGRSRLGLIAAVIALVGTLFAVPAQAHHGAGLPDNLACSDVLTPTSFPGNTYTLTHDVGPCDSGGLIVRKSGTSTTPFVIDLNGFTIYGTPLYGDRAGVWIDNQSYVTVKNGTIHSFDGGVEIWGGGNNKVENMVVRDNIGTETLATRWSEGVGIWKSDNNVICNNLIHHNGVFAGVAVYSHSGPPSATSPGTNNKIGDPACGPKAGTAGQDAKADGGNVITDNDANRLTSNEDIGVRITPGTHGNRVENNRVERNGLDGISVFRAPSPYTRDNVIKNNVVRFNGCHENTTDANSRFGEVPPSSDCGAGTGVNWDQFVNQRKGDGIRIHGADDGQNATANTVEANEVCGNAASGIRVDGGNRTGSTATASLKNTITGNTSGSNTAACPLNVRVPQATNPSYDLYDSKLNCTNNTWTSNSTNGSRRPSTASGDSCTIG